MWRARSAASRRSDSARDVVPGHAHVALARAVERAHDVEEGRLARAGWPHDREQLALLHHQAHAAKGIHPTGVALRQVADLQHGAAICAAIHSAPPRACPRGCRAPETST